MAKQSLGDLPDLNVWLALLNANHPHHAAAKHYWEEAAAARIAQAVHEQGPLPAEHQYGPDGQG